MDCPPHHDLSEIARQSQRREMNSSPPGFRFYPTEQELLSFYLYNKLNNQRNDMECVIPVVDVFSHEPWQLPPLAGELCVQDSDQWFFFSPQQEREAQGRRPNRTTASGYWKATGSPAIIFAGSRRIGVKKTMVFYEGRAPMGKKTKWVLNDYRLFQDATGGAAGDHSSGANPKIRAEFSLCRLYVRSGSLRSFDRRPPPVAGEAGTSRQREAAPPAESGKRRRFSSEESGGQIRDQGEN